MILTSSIRSLKHILGETIVRRFFSPFIFIENDLQDSYAIIDVQRIKSSATIVSISQLLSFPFILNENKRRKKSLHNRFSQNTFGGSEETR